MNGLAAHWCPSVFSLRVAAQSRAISQTGTDTNTSCTTGGRETHRDTETDGYRDTCVQMGVCVLTACLLHQQRDALEGKCSRRWAAQLTAHTSTCTQRYSRCETMPLSLRLSLSTLPSPPERSRQREEERSPTAPSATRASTQPSDLSREAAPNQTPHHDRPAHLTSQARAVGCSYSC